MTFTLLAAVIPRFVELIDLAKKSELARIDPSTLSKQGYYKSLQNSNERILDDRRRPDAVPAILLLYEDFGRFMELFSRREYACRFDMERQKLELAVDFFAETMTGISFCNKSRP